MRKHIYVVTIPIAGHISYEVEAASEKEAEDIAWNKPSEEGELQWETLSRFNSGNVCHCPSPWEVEVQDHGEVED